MNQPDSRDRPGGCNIHTVIFWTWVAVSALSLVSRVVMGE